jgi:DNA (cytosine-5)-methyltransferase 1
MAQSGGDTDLESETDNAEQDNRECGANGIIWGIVNSLESIGYSVQTFVIPACAVSAPHRRDRVWIVAHADRSRGGTSAGADSGQGGNVAHTELHNGSKLYRHNATPHTKFTNANRNTDSQRLERGVRTNKHPKQNRGQGKQWHENWLEVATRLCGVDDGLPAKLDGFKLSKAGHRVARLKGLGNAIVPQVAMEIMRAIKQQEGA